MITIFTSHIIIYQVLMLVYFRCLLGYNTHIVVTVSFPYELRQKQMEGVGIVH